MGNKTVYNESELKEIHGKRNVVVLEMLYDGYFGKGKNITHRTLSDNGWDGLKDIHIQINYQRAI